MEYYIKVGRYFVTTSIWFGLSILWIIKSIIKDDYSNMWFWSLSAVFFGWHVLRFLYRKLFKIPMLIVNESYLFDRFDNVKYYWNDINEIIETENVLYVYLYKPSKYTGRVKNVFGRIIVAMRLRLFPKKSPYVIPLHLIQTINKEQFLETLNNFSIAAGDKG